MLPSNVCHVPSEQLFSLIVYALSECLPSLFPIVHASIEHLLSPVPVVDTPTESLSYPVPVLQFSTFPLNFFFIFHLILLTIEALSFHLKFLFVLVYFLSSHGQSTASMARNASTNVDIPYKCTVDEIRLRVISDLQENYTIYKNIHVLPSMEEAK